MPKPAIIQPQRRNHSKAWTQCQPNQAQRWVVKLSGEVVGRHLTKALATAHADTINRGLAAKAKAATKTLTFASRYGPLGVRGKGTIIASSLHKDHLP